MVLLFLDLQKFFFHVYNQDEKLDHTYFYHFSIFSTENGLMKHDLQNVVFVLHHLPQFKYS